MIIKKYNSKPAVDNYFKPIKIVKLQTSDDDIQSWQGYEKIGEGLGNSYQIENPCTLDPVSLLLRIYHMEVFTKDTQKEKN